MTLAASGFYDFIINLNSLNVADQHDGTYKSKWQEFAWALVFPYIEALWAVYLTITTILT
jgi:hypothetical protein